MSCLNVVLLFGFLTRQSVKEQVLFQYCRQQAAYTMILSTLPFWKRKKLSAVLHENVKKVLLK